MQKMHIVSGRQCLRLGVSGGSSRGAKIRTFGFDIMVRTLISMHNNAVFNDAEMATMRVSSPYNSGSINRISFRIP